MNKMFLGTVLVLLIIQGISLWSIESPQAKIIKNVPSSITTEDMREFDKYSDYLIKVKIDSSIDSEPYFFDDLFLESYNRYLEADYKPLIIERENYRNSIENYNQYVGGVIETSVKQGLENIQNRYGKLRDLNLEPVNYHPVESFIRNSTPHLFVMMFSIFLGFSLANADLENNDFNLTNSKGDKDLSFVKIQASIISVAIFTLASNISLWIISTMIYGNVSLYSPIQTIPSLMQSPFAWTILQWISMVTLWNILAGVVITLITLLMYRVTRHAVIASGFAWTILLFLYQSIHSKTIFSFLRYFNPINLLESTKVFSRYNTPFYTLLENEFTLIIGVVLSIVFGILFLLFPQKYQRKSSYNIKTKIFNHTSMFKHTIQKLLINHKAMISLSFLLIIVGTQSFNTIEKSYTPMFKEMIEREQDIFESFTLEELQEQVSIYEEESKGINIMLQQGKSEEELSKYLILNEENEIARRTSKKVLRYMNLGYSVHPSGYEIIMSKNDQTKDILMSLMAVIATVVILAPLFASDDQDNDSKLYKATKNYNKQILMTVAVGFLLVQVIFLIVFSVQGVILLNTFYFEPTSVNNFLWVNSKFPAHQSTRHYISLLFLSRFIGLNLVCLITFIIAKITKSTWQTILSTLALILGPTIIGVSLKFSTSYLSTFDLILGNEFLNRSSFLEKSPLILVIVGLFIYIVKKNRMNNS